MRESIVKTKNLTKSYNGKNVVEDLQIEIGKGEVYGFLGPNGAGKSTTMKMLLGLAKPTEGGVEVFGKEFGPKTRSEILRKTGSIIESPSYYGHLTGLENMRIIETLLGLPKGSGEKALEIVRLTKEKDKKVSEYSLGMKQRLAIAMALARGPELLILDEPTNGLDPAGTQEIRKLILRLANDYGITIMVSSHLLSEIEKIADHVGIIDNGKLIYQGPLRDLEQLAAPYAIIDTSDNKRALALLSDLNPKYESGKIVVGEVEKTKRADIARTLFENGVDVYELYSERKDLEELFLEITNTRGIK